MIRFRAACVFARAGFASPWDIPLRCFYAIAAIALSSPAFIFAKEKTATESVVIVATGRAEIQRGDVDAAREAAKQAALVAAVLVVALMAGPKNGSDFGLAAVPLLVGCTSPEYQAWQEENAKYASSGQTSGGDAATTGELPAASTGSAGAGASTTDSANTGDTTAAVDASSGNDSAADDTTAEPVDPSIGDAEKPEIVAVELPAPLVAAVKLRGLRVPAVAPVGRAWR